MIANRSLTEDDGWIPRTDLERDTVLQELDEIRKSPLFASSKRYPSFLEYVVQETIAGRGDQLKERTIGAVVFGRDPAYDVSQDNIVRATAGEIRRRLLKHNNDPGCRSEIAIELLPGSYVPKFRKRPVEAQDSPPLRLYRLKPRRGWMRHGAVIALVCLLGVGLSRLLRPSTTGLELFWRPILESGSPALICMGTLESRQQIIPPADGRPVMGGSRQVTFQRAVSLANVVAFLKSKNIAYVIQEDLSTTLADLRSGPSIILGAHENEWAIRLTEPLRFSLRYDAVTQIGSIWDRQQPDQREWQRHFGSRPANLSADYALVSRFTDATTGRLVLIISGLHAAGTLAAVEFLTDTVQMQLFEARAPENWAAQNMQFIIGTKVIQGVSGRPQILRSHFWKP